MHETSKARVRSIRRSKTGADIATYILLSLFSLAILLPILWILRLSFTTKFIAYKVPPVWFFKPIIDNYVSLFRDYGFGRFFFNSTAVAIGSTLIAVPLAFFASYAFNRFRIGGRSLQFGILGLQMLPPIVLSIPIYVVMSTVNLLNTRVALILAYLSFNLPFIIWMLMGFMEGIPKDLEDAAIIDGATRLQTVIRIIFPLATPGVMAAGIYSFILCWNEFLFALMLTAEKSSTIPIALAAMQTERGVMLGTLAAAMSFAILPMIALSVAIQKYLVRGLTFGALK
jgi:multiple sugar transport system permease protein